MRKEFVCVVTRCFLALGFFCAVSAQAADAQTTINVPADQPTIQAGISAAVDGDTVMVAPGTYFENLNFFGRAITVTSSGGPSVTIVDGGGLAPVVTFGTNEGVNSVLNGFTLQNGVPSQGFVVGGGIFVYFASPTITNNTITGNHAVCGAGIEIFSGSPVVRGNTITGNTQAGGACSTGTGGGGIEVTTEPGFPTAAPQIIGNTITNNSLAFGDGGGIEVNGSSSPLIQNNYISGNSVQGSGGGIALESNGAPLVVQNIIVNNSSGGLGSGGAGIYLASSSSTPTNAALINNTIANNDGLDGSSGIYADVVSPVPVINNIVIAASGENGIVCNPANTVFPAFSHNDVLSPGTGGQAWSSNCASFAQSNGNISGDPRFLNPANGDYHVEPSSATDAGDNTAPNLPQQDYDGNPRVVDANGDCVDTVDLGAYELQSSPQANFTLVSPVAFPDQIVNTTSSPLRFELQSSGTACVKVTAISITGDFAQTNNCPAVLPPSDSCVLNVTFTPTTTGLRTGILTMTGNQVPSPTGAGPEVDFSGNGVAPVGSVAPSSLTFDAQLVNTSSAAQIITLSNTGIGALQIYAIGISGDFSQSNNCPARLNAGTSCVIQVVFSPTVAGARAGSLTVSSNSISPVPAISLGGTAVQPAISISPATISFGDQILNTSATQTVTVNNPGSATLHVSSVVIFSSTTSASISVVSNDCQGTTGVAPGGTCSIQVQFNPFALGLFSGTLSITSDAPNSVTNVPISGNGVEPTASISPASLSFGNQFLNTTSAAQAVTLSSTGTAPLSISGISASGDFSQTNNCPASLAVGSSCIIQVTFDPTATGPRNGAVSITNNSVPVLHGFTMSGTGVDPLTVSPASLSFPSEPLNTASTAQTVTVSNIGTSPVQISSIAISGDFSQTNACPASLAPGSSCAIQVAFSPTVIGTGAGSLSITSGGLPTLAVALTGTGVNPLSISPASLSFLSQPLNTTSTAQTVTISNISTSPVLISSITISGDFFQTNSCGTSVAANTSCAIEVTFRPTVLGTRSGSLSITSGGLPTLAVPLTGTGVDPQISVNPAAVSFADQPINTTGPDQFITVTNPGTTALHVSSTLVSGSPYLNVLANNCTAAVAPAGSCTIELEFTPLATGAASATLSIGSDAPTSPTTVALSGKGIDPIGTLSPSSLNFGNQVLNTSSAAQTITLSNTGTDPLTISGISVSGNFTQTNTCPASLAVGSSCAIQVTFHPTATGALSGFLSVASNSSPPVVQGFVTGTGVNPAISVSPGSIAFGGQLINTDAPAQTITVSNPGTTTLHVNSLSVSGDPDFFTLTNNCVSGTGVVPGGTCSIQVEFAPKSVGVGSATLSIGSDAPNSPTNVPLSGNGVNSSPTLSPTSLSFGNVFVGKTSGGKSVQLTSNGPSALAISSISVSAGFIQTNNCPASLSPGSSCNINVSFKPLAPGAVAGALSIVNNGLGSPQSVALSGNGLDFSVSASPSSATVTAGQKAGYTITVSAQGGSYSTNVALSCSGLPTGVKCSFSPSGVSPGSSSAGSSLTVSTTSGSTGTPAGSYSIRINGTANGTTHSTIVGLDVN